MDNNKVTVLIISKDDKLPKSFELDKKYITNYRKYLKGAVLILSFCFVLVLSLIAYALNLEFERTNLNAQLTEANRQIDIVSENKVKQRLENIDQNLAKINEYLQKRGALQSGSIGGESSQKQEEVYSKLKFSEEQSVVFMNKLESLPLGYPYNGPVSSGYGYRTNPFGGRSGEFHPGIDFKGQIGDPIYATANGIVKRCDWYNGYGNAVVLIHENGIETLFGHMSSVNVTQGRQVKAGDLIGFLGTTGRSTGPHVHYEIRKDGDDIDPVPFLTINSN